MQPYVQSLRIINLPLHLSYYSNNSTLRGGQIALQYLKYDARNKMTLHCSASVRRTSVEAEPSRRKSPNVSFSRHMSLIARAVFPVSFREWTNTKT